MEQLTSSFFSTKPLPLPLSPNPLHFRRRRTTSLRTTSASNSPDPITALTRLLWGRALPPQPLISAVRTTWSAAWHLMMRQLAPSSSTGSYSRPVSRFPSVPSVYSQNPGRKTSLHLYVGLPCPWAHRTLITRAIKNLEQDLQISIASPGSDGSWEFKESSTETIKSSVLVAGQDRANRKGNLREVYGMINGGYDGRSTVPMLWDSEKKEVVCNESYGIMEFLNLIGSGPNLFPAELQEEIQKWNEIIYPSVNNGVYRCGFAQSQEAYDIAASELFTTLDKIDSHLSTNRFLCGDTLTLADICLFTTLIRFDLVYNVLFKCTKKKLVEYQNLYDYMREIYQIPKVAETCNFEAIMDGYYRTLFPLNPGSIRPVMPLDCESDSLSKPHNRDSLSKPVQLSSV
ncbi:hypothetical protein LUZ60_006831 [Juncus effusus]|nr:hypothetical protein LUZ60_006831 [Juncus effusus]